MSDGGEAARKLVKDLRDSARKELIVRPYLVDMAKKVAGHIESKDEIIEQLSNALERIAFEGVGDRESLIASALDYVSSGGQYPNERTIAAVALSKARANKPNEGTR